MEWIRCWSFPSWPLASCRCPNVSFEFGWRMFEHDSFFVCWHKTLFYCFYVDYHIRSQSLWRERRSRSDFHVEQLLFRCFPTTKTGIHRQCYPRLDQTTFVGSQSRIYFTIDHTALQVIHNISSPIDISLYVTRNSVFLTSEDQIRTVWIWWRSISSAEENTAFPVTTLYANPAVYLKPQLLKI